MADVKDLALSAAKWGRNAGAASTEFAANAAAKADVWARNTQAASDTFRAAITAGNIAERFKRGVAKAAQSGKFARRLAAVGQSRYSEGVSGAQDEWSTGFAPYHAALATVSLPARRPRGDVANLERVKAITTLLHAKRIAGLGS